MRINDPAIHKPIGDACDQIMRTALTLTDPMDQLEVMAQATALLIAMTERAVGKTSAAIALHRARKNLAKAVKANALKKG